MNFLTRYFRQIAIFSVTLLVLGFYQNCSKIAVKDNQVSSASNAVGQSVAVTTCGTHADGSTWSEVSSDILTSAQACSFGGDLAYNYKKMIEYNCVNGATQLTGNVSQGEMLPSTGSCSAPTCAGRAQGSVWSVVNGTLSSTKACPSSTATVQNIFENLDNYKCDQGNSIKTGSVQGNQIGTQGVCPAPMITAVFDSSAPKQGDSVKLIVTTSAVSAVNYTCSTGSTGSLALTPSTTVVGTASSDMSCTVVGTNSDNKSVSVTVSTSVVCSADSIKDANGVCQQFKCKTFLAIDRFPFDVPGRDSSGTCYYTKIFSAITNSASRGSRDYTVLSRDHDNPSSANAIAPYVLGQSSTQFRLLAARGVKLSGSSEALAPILVDNYILVGQQVASSGGAAAAISYKSYGTSDATIKNTNYVLKNNVQIPLTPFASAGTATVAALLMTQDFAVNQSYVLSVDALDCGGSRELSDVYLVFQ